MSLKGKRKLFHDLIELCMIDLLVSGVTDMF